MTLKLADLAVEPTMRRALGIPTYVSAGPGKRLPNVAPLLPTDLKSIIQLVQTELKEAAPRTVGMF